MHGSYDNDLLLRTMRGERVERPPVWLMRQAGRILPQYRALKKSVSGFRELVETPEMAAEATIQPVDELGVDAAILFCDILVIPDAMGISYKMVKGKGPVFDQPLRDTEQIEELPCGVEAATDLQYVYDAVEETVDRLEGRVPLIGFVGAPWTLMAYMIEGKGSKAFSTARRWLYKYPEASHRLLDKITDTSIAYARNKVKSGVEVIQIFDSWAGLLNEELFGEFFRPRIQKIYEELRGEVHVIYFPKNAWFVLPQLRSMDELIVSLDWGIPPHRAREVLGEERILQGNLDPAALYADPADIRRRVQGMLDAFGRRHVVNLGHGVYPDLPLEGIEALIKTVKNYKYE